MLGGAASRWVAAVPGVVTVVVVTVGDDGVPVRRWLNPMAAAVRCPDEPDVVVVVAGGWVRGDGQRPGPAAVAGRLMMVNTVCSSNDRR